MATEPIGGSWPEESAGKMRIQWADSKDVELRISEKCESITLKRLSEKPFSLYLMDENGKIVSSQRIT